jgi:hypothetical protein
MTADCLTELSRKLNLWITNCFLLACLTLKSEYGDIRFLRNVDRLLPGYKLSPWHSEIQYGNEQFDNYRCKIITSSKAFVNLNVTVVYIH